MKKSLSIILMFALAAVLFSGCGNKTAGTGGLNGTISVSAPGKTGAPAADAAALPGKIAEVSGDTVSGDEKSSVSIGSTLGKVTEISFDKAVSAVTADAWTSWKNPRAHRKPQEGVKHSEEDYQKHLTVYCLNEGKADAFILFSGTTNAVIIDTGCSKDGDDILDILEEHDLTHVSAMILSHFDKDHIGGADEVIRGADVENIYVTRGSKDSKQYRELQDEMELNNKEAIVVKEPVSFEVDGTKYEIFPPKKDSWSKDSDDSNNSSLVVKVTNADNSMLFAGDAENERLEELIASDYDLSADILKIPHHGRIEKLSAAFLRKVAPQYAVITSSEKDPEDDSLMKLLKEYEIETYLTRKGEILIDTLPGEIAIDQYND